MDEDSDLKRRTRRAFLTLGVSFLSGAGIWAWVMNQPQDQGVPWPFRKALLFNESLWRHVFSPSRTAPRPPAPPAGTPVRFNGDLGLEDEVDPEEWRLNVIPPGESSPIPLSMSELALMPRTETTALFKCIEGWSIPISYAGIRFSDFMHYLKIENPMSYVALSTPDGKYYVSIDLESMMNPQTVLAYEMNGQPLSDDNGAPLRLIIPIKYGIKSLKRIGTIRFSNTRPPDYWAERGYDWYSGL